MGSFNTSCGNFVTKLDHCLSLSWAADGQDGNGLQLEKKWANFFKFVVWCLGKLAKTQIMVDFPLKYSFDIFLLVFYTYFVYDKGT